MRAYKLKLENGTELSVINYRDKVAIGLLKGAKVVAEVHLPLCDADKLSFYIEEVCHEIRQHNLEHLHSDLDDGKSTNKVFRDRNTVSKSLHTDTYDLVNKKKIGE